MDTAKRIEVNLPCDQESLTFDKVEELNDLLDRNKGKIHVYINLISREHKSKVSLVSAEKKIDLNQDVFDWLMQSECQFKIHC